MAEEITNEDVQELNVDLLTDEENDAFLEQLIGEDISEDASGEVIDSRDAEPVAEVEVEEVAESEKEESNDEVEESTEDKTTSEETEPEEKSTGVEEEATTEVEVDEVQQVKDTVYKELFEEGVKAKGVIRKVRDAAHLKTLVQIGLGASDTVRSVKPYMKSLRSLEQAGLDVQDENKLNFLVDVMNGNKDAIKELIFNKHNIDGDTVNSWLDERVEGKPSEYVPNNHVIDDTTFAVREQLDEASTSTHYSRLTETLGNLDDDGKAIIKQFPHFITNIKDDMESGIYDIAMDEALSRMDRGILPKQSELSAYVAVMQDEQFLASLNESATTEEQVIPATSTTEITKKKVISRKKKASPTVVTKKSVTPRSNKPVNVDKLSDDEFNELFDSLDILD